MRRAIPSMRRLRVLAAAVAFLARWGHRLAQQCLPHPPLLPATACMYDIGATSGALLSMTNPQLSGTDWWSLTAFQSGLVVSLSLAGALLGSGESGSKHSSRGTSKQGKNGIHPRREVEEFGACLLAIPGCLLASVSPVCLLPLLPQLASS